MPKSRKTKATLSITKGPGHVQTHTYADGERFLKDLETALGFYPDGQVAFTVAACRASLAKRAADVAASHARKEATT